MIELNTTKTAQTKKKFHYCPPPLPLPPFLHPLHPHLPSLLHPFLPPLPPLPRRLLQPRPLNGYPVI